jgi:RNA polymerase sigma factor (sigma-70 family)
LEASALQHASRLPALPGRSPLLRLQSDERLIALTRRGNAAAFEALVHRYQSRLMAFCRHMLGSTEDAEDVLQEVFAASYHALLGDDRSINARPWLYRIARNRCLNHLRRPVAAGQDSMDVFERDGGSSAADTVHRREEFRQIVADVQDLPETQRTALLLREIDALSYDQIAEAMDTTVPSVKSLLVRARVSLAEAAEARLLSCEEVRLELGQVAEGLTRTTAPVRRHLKSCERCRTFRTELRRANRALAAVYPIGAIAGIKLFVSKLGVGAASGSGGSSSAAGGAGFAGAAGGAASTAGGTTAGGVLSAGAYGIATKAAAGLAAAAIVTAGAAEVKQSAHRSLSPRTHDGVASAVVQSPPTTIAAIPGIVERQLTTLPPVVAPAQKASKKSEPSATKASESASTSASPPPAQPAATSQSSSSTTTVASAGPPPQQQSGQPQSSSSNQGNSASSGSGTQTDSSTVTLGGSGSSGGDSSGPASDGSSSQPSTSSPPASGSGPPAAGVPEAPAAAPSGESGPPGS